MEEILRFSLFSELDKIPQGIDGLSRILKSETFNPRDWIIDERQNDSRIFFLLSGQVEVNKIGESGEVVILHRVDSRSNPCFGEGALLGETRRSANVMAYTRCECLSLHAKDLENFVRAHPLAAVSIYRNLAKIIFGRLAKADRDIFIAGMTLKR